MSGFTFYAAFTGICRRFLHFLNQVMASAFQMAILCVTAKSFASSSAV
jgi:hypothetical protein